MFDKLIVSEPEGADFKNRRNYFMVSSLVVGVLFLAAVVFSIYASDYGLGTREFELTEMLTPEDVAAVEPEPESPRNARQSRSTNAMPTRQAIIPRIDDSQIVPTTTSVVPNTQMQRLLGYFKISRFDSNPDISNGTGRNNSGPTTTDTSLGTPQTAADNTIEVTPPPIRKEPAIKRIVSGGVVNGNATDLPKPVYSAAAKAVGAQGKVDVQVTIDESGKVISTKAISGHILLRDAAEKAAWNARFTPTYLSKVAVKVTGVIVYNFVR